MVHFNKKLPYGLNAVNSTMKVENDRKLNIVENALSNTIVKGTKPDPFMFSPQKSSEYPLQKPNTPSFENIKPRDIDKFGGSINADLFNIDFNKSKNKRKKVVLKFD